MRLSTDTRRAKQGFTLLELIIVVSILVILAGYVLGKLDILDMKANKGVAASNMGGVSRYLQLFRVNSTLYPDGWDSLCTTSGALWATTTPNTKCLDPQVLGTTGPVPGSPHKLTTTAIDLTDGEVRSLARMGITTLYDVDTSAGIGAPGDAFGNDGAATIRTISPTMTNAAVATLNLGTGADPQHQTPAAALANGADEDAIGIARHVYPTALATDQLVPDGKRLVVFGFGRFNKCIGNSTGALLNEAPFYANTNSTLYYNRFLCVFEVDDGGSRAKLVAVLGSDGDRIDEEVADFYEQE